MNDRSIFVVSGLPYSGKSSLVKQLCERPWYEGAVTFSQDKSGRSLYRDRNDAHITKTEHIFKNEWMRYEILRSLVLGAKIVLVDSVMLTRLNHQKPMIEMIARAQQYVQAIELEKENQVAAPSSQAPIIRLKVLLCFATPEVLESRLLSLESQDRIREDFGPLLDLRGIWGAYQYFEFPDTSTYEPIYVDTSDVSPRAQHKRMAGIDKFFREGVIDVALNESSKQKALDSYQVMYAKVQAAAGSSSAS